MSFTNEPGKPRLDIIEESLVMLKEMRVIPGAKMFMVFERAIKKVPIYNLYIYLWTDILPEDIFFLNIYFISWTYIFYIYLNIALEKQQYLVTWKFWLSKKRKAGK